MLTQSLEQSPKDRRGGQVSYLLLGRAGELASHHLAVTWVEGPPESEQPTHEHERSEQAYVIVRGKGLMKVGDERQEVEAGTLVYIPAGSPHSIRTTGDQPLVYVSATTPPFEVSAGRWGQGFEDQTDGKKNDQTVGEARTKAVHPNDTLLRREYAARARRDDESLADTFADDVVWHVPGRNAISGVYRGKAEVMDYVRRRRVLADDTFEITVQDVLANDEHGLVIASGRATRGGKPVEWRAHGLYRFEDGKIAECWVLPEDQAVFDEIWS